MVQAVPGAIAVVVLDFSVTTAGLRGLLLLWLRLLLADTGTVVDINIFGDSNDIHCSRLRRLLRLDNGSS